MEKETAVSTEQHSDPIVQDTSMYANMFSYLGLPLSRNLEDDSIHPQFDKTIQDRKGLILQFRLG